MKALVLLFVAGCVGQSIDDIGIACTQDSECPSGAWCDLRFNDNQCRSLDTSGPPHVAYDGFLVGSQVVQTLSVPSKTTTIHSFQLRNDGGSQTYITVDVLGPPCLDAQSLVRTDGELVDQGATLKADFDVDPAAGCASPAPLGIQATASGRTFTFMTMITIAP